MTCQVCKGTGRVPCGLCSGSGRTNIGAYGVTGSMRMSAPCPACRGSGFTTCRACGGASFISSRDPTRKGTESLGHNTIEPLKHINGIRPKWTTPKEVVDFFGVPDRVNSQMTTTGDVVYYDHLGLVLFFDYGAVYWVCAQAPFSGVTSNGLSIGMDSSKATAICSEHYKLISSDAPYYRYSSKADEPGEMQLRFEDEELTTITMF